MLALNAAAKAGMATWSVAGREYPTTAMPLVRHAELLELWSRYQSTVWETTNYSALKGNEALYRYTRSLVNPVRQLVDFYASQAYPGRCRSPRGPLPEGYQDAIPLDCPEPLAVAIAQWWEWAGWQSEKSGVRALRRGAGQRALRGGGRLAGGQGQRRRVARGLRGRHHASTGRATSRRSRWSTRAPTRTGRATCMPAPWTARRCAPTATASRTPTATCRRWWSTATASARRCGRGTCTRARTSARPPSRGAWAWWTS
jgi:hypothetical protein